MSFVPDILQYNEFDPISEQCGEVILPIGGEEEVVDSLLHEMYLRNYRKNLLEYINRHKESIDNGSNILSPDNAATILASTGNNTLPESMQMVVNFQEPLRPTGMIHISIPGSGFRFIEDVRNETGRFVYTVAKDCQLIYEATGEPLRFAVVNQQGQTEIKTAEARGRGLAYKGNPIYIFRHEDDLGWKRTIDMSTWGYGVVTHKASGEKLLKKNFLVSPIDPLA